MKPLFIFYNVGNKSLFIIYLNQGFRLSYAIS